jgi:nitroreductase
MTDLDAIELRQSRRTYLNTPIAVSSLRKLKAAIDEYNQLSGLSIQFIDDGHEAFQGINISYGMFHGVRSFIAIVAKTSDQNAKEKAGYYGELLVLKATKLGLGTCWVGGSFNRKHCPCKVLSDEALLIIITIGNVADRKDLKENIIYKLVRRHTKSLEELYSSDTPVPDWFLKGMKAVQKAPSANNRQPVYFSYKSGIVTAQVKSTDNHEQINLGIAKAHFEIGAGGKFELGNVAVLIK